MRFSSLKLESWKNFKKVEVELQPRVFIIGANASGKSNLLDAVRFLHDLTTEGGGLAKAVSLRGGMSRIRSLHATINSKVAIEAAIEDENGTRWSYRLGFSGKRGGEPEVSEEVVKRNNKELLQRPSADDRADHARLRQTAIEQVSENKEFRAIAEFFRSIRTMSLVPQLIREGQVNPGLYPGQDPLGRDLLDLVRQTPVRTRKKRFVAIDGVLRHIVPSFKNLNLVTDKHGRPHLEVEFEHWRSNAVKQWESQFSDGTLRLVGMLWALQEDAGPLLLEEPEWSLHTGILERLAAFIARMQAKGGGRQILITTHSERLLSDPGIDPTEVLLIVPAEKGGSEVKAAARYPVVEAAMRKGLTAAQAAQPLTRLRTMDLFGQSA